MSLTSVVNVKKLKLCKSGDIYLEFDLTSTEINSEDMLQCTLCTKQGVKFEVN